MGDGDGQGSLLGCSPQGHKELDLTERLNSNNAVVRGSRRVFGLKSNRQMFPFSVSGGLGLQRLGPGLGFPAGD